MFLQVSKARRPIPVVASMRVRCDEHNVMTKCEHRPSCVLVIVLASRVNFVPRCVLPTSRAVLPVQVCCA